MSYIKKIKIAVSISLFLMLINPAHFAFGGGEDAQLCPGTEPLKLPLLGNEMSSVMDVVNIQNVKQKKEISLSLEDKRGAAQQIEVGDIVFTRYHGGLSNSPIDYAIRSLQNLSNSRDRNRNLAPFSNVVHSSIVVKVDQKNGSVLVAEAIPSKNKNALKITDLFLDRKLEDSSRKHYEYHFYRTQSHLGIVREATQIAANLASLSRTIKDPDLYNQPLAKKGKHSFNYLLAIPAVFKSGSGFSLAKSPKLRQRIVKQLIDEYLRKTTDRMIASGRSDFSSFFCSYFIAYILQRAELSEKVDHFFSEEEKAALDRISKLNNKDHFLEINKVSKELLEKKQDQLDSLLGLIRLDPAFVSPEKLANYLEKSLGFEDRVVVSPKAR